MKILTRYICLFLCLFILKKSKSQTELDTIILSNKLSVLNDKAYFTFPNGSYNSARPVDIMSADNNTNIETRIILDVGEMMLVFFVQELFKTGDKKIISDVIKLYGEEKYTHKVLSERDSLISVLSTPTKFDSTKNAILINTLLVKTQDNSLFRIDAYINPKAFRLKNEFQKLSENTFKTLVKGPRKNNRNKREEKYSVLGGKKQLKITLPADYYITVDKKYDFEVFNFHKYTKFSDTNWVNLVMYNGFHPSYFYPEYSFKESSATKKEGTFIGETVEWLFFNRNNFYLKEQKIPVSKIETDLIVHIAMLGNQEIYINELTKIVESITLTE